MKIINLCTVLLATTAGVSHAQTNADAYRKHMADSIKRVSMTEAAIRNPTLRQVVVSTDVIAPTNIKSELHGNKLFDAKLSQVRTTAIFTVPITSWGKNSISTTLSAFQQRFHLSEVTPHQTGLGDLEGRTINKLTVGFSGSFTRIDSLFGRQIVYLASVSGLTGESSSVQKMSYLGALIFTFKQTPKTRLNLGLLINIDPSVNVPVIPIITYWHKFENDLELNVNLPREIALRKTISPKLWVNFGTSLAGSIAFFKHNRPDFPEDGNYSTLELKTGPGMEYRFERKFIFGVNAGAITAVQAREFKVGDNANNHFLNNRITTAPYVNFTFSVLPFL